MEDPPDDLIQITDLPRSLLDDAFAQIRNFSTCFVIENKLAGSGTFARIDGIPGILTARHVWDHVAQSARLTRSVGLLIADVGHTFSLPLDTLLPLLNLKSREPHLGPDIEFVEIPRAKVAEIEARRSFQNLSKSPQARIEASESRRGLLVMVGYPDDRTSIRDYPEKQRRAHVFFNLGLVVAIDSVKARDGFDFLELDTGRSDSTQDYRGVSGGGIWKVSFAKKFGAPAKDSFLEDFCLCGVAFYQTDVRDNARSILAHGPRSIYETIPRILAER